MSYKTLFEYIIENIDRKYSNISEAKIDTEYEKNFSAIPRDIFDSIVRMDPKTQVVGDEIRNMGFGSKQLLLPKYLAGEVDFVETPEAVTAALADYYPNIANYPKFNEFRSVSDFLTFMQDPDGAEIEKVQQESPMDKLYNKYYSNIDREIFNKILAMDSKSTDDRIGEIAKNLLLIAYQRGEHDFIERTEAVKAAIDLFYKKGHNYPDGKDNIQNFSSVAEFIDYKPTSPTVAAVASQNIIQGRDFELITSSDTYDVFKALTWEGSKAIAHARGAQNSWCTAGGADGRQWLDRDGVGTYYRHYQPDGSKHAQVYQIINRNQPTLKTYNYNLAVDATSGNVTEFRDGDNMSGAGGFGEKGAEVFTQVLLSDPELLDALKTCSEPLLRKCPTVHQASDLLAALTGPVIINSKADFAKFFNADKSYLRALRGSTKEIRISNIDEIPYGCFAQFSGLETIIFDEGLKKISGQAFKTCLNLKSLTLPETLEIIGPEAFAGCTKLRGAVRIPDAVKEIGERAFAETHCKLKVNKARTTKLKMSRNDMEWIKTHVQSITV